MQRYNSEIEKCLGNLGIKYALAQYLKLDSQVAIDSYKINGENIIINIISYTIGFRQDGEQLTFPCDENIIRIIEGEEK